MGTYKELDYFKWAKEMDIVSWDNYPAYNTPWSLTAMRHDLMRGLKNAPFMLMEQTPSQQSNPDFCDQKSDRVTEKRQLYAEVEKGRRQGSGYLESEAD